MIKTRFLPIITSWTVMTKQVQCKLLKSWTVCQLFFATYKLFSFREK